MTVLPDSPRGETSSIPESSSQKSTNVRTKTKPSAALQALRMGLGALGAVAPQPAAAIAEHLFLTPKRHRRPAVEHELLAQARHLLVPGDASALGSCQLASWEWGQEGPRVLLVHGWEGRGAQLGSLVGPLLDRGFRVVTFDAPGHGKSPGSTSSLVHFARAVERMAEAYGPFEAIITHSMGGAATAWAFHQELNQWPTRSAPLAKRLVMIAPPIDVRDFTRQLSQTLLLSDEVRTEVERRLGKRLGVAPSELHIGRIAPRMTTPLLVIHDEEDRDVPIACGETIASSWPGAKLIRTKSLGHRRILRDAQVIVDAVRFASGAGAAHECR